METEKLEILESILGRSYRSGNECLFKCPKCEHEKRKLSVNLNKGVFKCWVCEYSGLKISKLLKKYGDRSHLSRWQDLDGTVDIASFEEIFSKVEKKKEQTIFLPRSFKTLTGNNKGPGFKRAISYLRSRNITRADILKWKIGFCDSGEFQDRICVPSFDQNGELNYFVARSYVGSFPKYKNPPVSRDVIFNDLFIDWEKPVTLVEGIFDAMVAEENSIPILGSALKETSKLFQKISEKRLPVYLALDPDAKEKEQKIINSFLEYGIKVYKIGVAPFEDVGSMTKEEFIIRKKEAKIMNSMDYLYQRLKF